ncbi:MAG TPA: hypothetical protein DCQ31_05770 [Bacteroidales bacterium]|nr:hypothetical protein [Bacteroidales bacterium]
MNKRWSSLQKDIEKLFVPELKMQIRCHSYPIGRYSNAIPCFYVTLSRLSVWEYPKLYATAAESFHGWASQMEFSQTIRNYINCPLNEVFKMNIPIGKYQFGTPGIETAENDLIQILIAADRRLGKEKLLAWFAENPNKYAQIVLNLRFENVETSGKRGSV